MIGLLYKAYPDGCQQVLLRLRPYLVRGHGLLYGKLNLCVQRARAVLASLVAQEVAWRQSSLQTGPHQVIRNPEVRLWWWRSFGSALLQTYGSLGTEEITWERFWSSFPKGLEE